MAVADGMKVKYAVRITQLKNPIRRAYSIDKCRAMPHPSTHGRASRFHTNTAIENSIANAPKVSTPHAIGESVIEEGIGNRRMLSERKM